MTTISLADWGQSPEIIIGEKEHQQVTVAALTNVGQSSDRTDFLLYELDRARVVPDNLLPDDVVRLGSVVRYKPFPGRERTIKLVMPDEVDPSGAYRISVTSADGAALLGLRPDNAISWLDASGATHRIKVLRVANPGPADDPGPNAA
jgi:regulator of nucleoside diphosphate kinase